MAPWSYRSYDGMGLLEFLEWCEDMKAKPLLAVFAGYTLNRDYVGSGTELEGFVKDALDEIEYVIGGVSTKWGAQRAKDGHPKPFSLEFVEIGNEDGFDGSGSYEGRFVQFYDAIKKKYPRLKIISTTGGKDPIGQRFKITKRRPDIIDEHYYDSTWQMMANATKYDSYDRKGPGIFVGEWAAQDVPAPWEDAGHKGPTPNMNCALADAAFMTGLERNSDLIKMACYAPLLVNVNPGGRQWAVNLIGYDALTSFGSPSYYAQKMFMSNLGDYTVPTTLQGAPTQSRGTETIPGIFVSTTRDSKTGTLYIKVVNALEQAQTVNLAIKGQGSLFNGLLTTLSGELKTMNTLSTPKAIAPIETRIDNLGTENSFTFAGHSVSLLKVQVK
jgi:alpha-N-arabinofuranosidase